MVLRDGQQVELGRRRATIHRDDDPPHDRARPGRRSTGRRPTSLASRRWNSSGVAGPATGRSRPSVSRVRPARSSAWPGSVGSGRTELARASSASSALVGGEISHRRRRARRIGSSARRHRRSASTWCRRTASARASSLDFPIREEHHAAEPPGALAHAASSIAARRRREALTQRAAASTSAPPSMAAGAGVAVGRQPAEGRAGQMAVDGAAGADLRRADARHRCRRQERDLSADARAGRPHGVGVLMISSDMEEVIGVSDRVAVMHEGRIAGFLERDELSEQAILSAGRRTDAALQARDSVIDDEPRDLGLLVLIIVVGHGRRHPQPALPLADQPVQHRQPDRPVRHLRGRRRPSSSSPAASSCRSARSSPWSASIFVDLVAGEAVSPGDRRP